MAKLSAQQLYELARGAGLSPTTAVVAAAVALGESGGNPDAVGDVSLQNAKWGPSVGLWQIRSLHADRGTGRARDASRLTDPAFNARAMAEISGAGGNWRPWSVYTSGKYRDHLPTAVQAAAGSTSVFNPLESVGETVGGAAGAVGDAVGGALGALNPLAVFEGWQNDLQRIAVTLAVGSAALWLVVAGVKAAAGGDE